MGIMQSVKVEILRDANDAPLKMRVYFVSE